MQIPGSLAEVQRVLLQLVKESAIQDPEAVVGLSTIPSKDLKGFDSLTELEVLTDLEEATGLHVDEGVFQKPNKHYRTIGEVADAVWRMINDTGNKHVQLV